MPSFVTNEICSALRMGGDDTTENGGLVSCFDDQPFLSATGFRLEPIRLRHDGGPTFGFRLEVSTERRGKPVSIGYLADTGSWSDSMVDSLAEVDVLGVEFNHDVAMQRSSGRSWALIARNLGDHGHLSNRQGAEFVEAVLERSPRLTLRHVVLLHLSEQCNQPELAMAAAQAALGPARQQIMVHAANQAPAHPNLWIRPGSRSFKTKGSQPIAGQTRISSSRSRANRFGGTPVLAGLFDWDSDRDADSLGTR